MKRDILKHSDLFEKVCEAIMLYVQIKQLAFDVVVAPEHGAVKFGEKIAQLLGKPFIPVKKQANGQFKLEETVIGKVLFFDDVISTGGSVKRCMKLFQGIATIVMITLICNRGGVKFEGIESVSLVTQKVITYAPEECPACKEHKPISLTQHGLDFLGLNPSYPH